MSVRLVKVKGPDGDGGGEGVDLTLPVVLGRGSLLKCGDKKVSRRHAYLDWEDKGVLITAVHQSPTYVVQGKGEMQAVMEGTSLLLTHGDKFGLLRDKFWYRVSLSSTLMAEEKEPATSSKKEEEGERIEDEEGKEERNTEERKMEEEERIEDEERKEERNTEEGKMEKEDADETRQKTKEATENIEVCKRSDKAVNGDEAEEATRRIEDTAERGNHEAKEDEGKIARIEPEPQEQEGTEEGGIEKRSDSPPSPSIAPSTTPSKTVTREEIMSAISKKERKLPSWLQHTMGAKPAAPSTPPPKPAVRGRRGQPKTNTPSPQKKVNSPSTTSAPPQTESDENLFSLDTTSKRRQKGSPARPQKAKKTLQQQNESSPVKGGGGGRGGVNYQISDSEEEETAVTTTTSTTSTTTTTTTTATATGGGGGVNQISDSEEEETAVTSTTTTTAVSPPSSPHQANKTEEKEGEDTFAKPPKRVFPNPATTTARNSNVDPNPPRPSCQYGANCYRKNPVHREEEAHPGDTDYRSPGEVDSDEGDERPQCEFGVDCYRKNPQHRRDYKHSRIPQPQRRAKRKARQQKGRNATGGGSEEDDYDFDDPFLNDGSSDDYAPTGDSSDSAPEPSQEGTEEEDTKRMLKEARKFVKKRK